jgi:hypothetical protein
MFYMKKPLVLLGLFAVLANGYGQGTVQFNVVLSGANEVPPNGSTFFGSGSFVLTGTSLEISFGVYDPMPKPTDATINGPANPSSIGPVLFDFGGNPVQFAPGIHGEPGGWTWGGSEILTAAQIADLESGKWYANITSTTFPGGELRGEILPVPEPSSLALLALGTGLFIIPARSSIRARKTRHSK